MDCMELRQLGRWSFGSFQECFRVDEKLGSVEGVWDFRIGEGIRSGWGWAVKWICRCTDFRMFGGFACEWPELRLLGRRSWCREFVLII